MKQNGIRRNVCKEKCKAAITGIKSPAYGEPPKVSEWGKKLTNVMFLVIEKIRNGNGLEM